MNHIVLIALGGAAGALSRHWMVNLVNSFHKSHFPFGTITVNLLGSFFIGIMYVLITERLRLHPDWRSIAMVGFLGAFTTFSTFSLETITLLENGQLASAGTYVMSSVAICMLAAWGGINLARLVA